MKKYWYISNEYIVDIWQALAADVHYESQYWFCWKLMSKHRLVILNIQQYNASRCNLRVLTVRKRLHKSLNVYIKLNLLVKYWQSLFNIQFDNSSFTNTCVVWLKMKNKVEIFIICSRIFTVIVAIAENRKKKRIQWKSKICGWGSCLRRERILRA